MKTSKTILILLLVFFFTSCATKQNTPIFISEPEKVDSLLESYVDNGSFPMLYMRIENKNGELLYEHQAINQSLLPNTQINGDSWFRIWSMSKIITISLVLDLVEEGTLSLTDPVSKFIPEFSDLKIAVNKDGKTLAEISKDYFSKENPEPGPYVNNPNLSKENCPWYLTDRFDPMTIIDLINHQAGFYYATTPFTCLNQQLDALNINSLNTNEEVIQKLATLPLIVRPGGMDFYGLNTTVLGFVAERATGKTLNQLLEERIKIPLKIKGLRYKKTPQINLFPVYSAMESDLRLANEGELDIMGKQTINYNPDNESFFGGEGMLGTANGYADFLRMLLNHGELNGHRFLEKSTVQEIYAPHTQLDNEWGYNGYNLWVSSKKELEMGTGDEGLWSGGGYEQTHFWVDPKRDFVAVIMTQMFAVPPQGYDRNQKIRGEIYKQLFAQEKRNHLK